MVIVCNPSVRVGRVNPNARVEEQLRRLVAHLLICDYPPVTLPVAYLARHALILQALDYRAGCDAARKHLTDAVRARLRIVRRV